MLRYGSGRSVSTTTTTTDDSSESSRERRIRRLRLTLHAGDNGNNGPKAANPETAERDKDVSGAWKKKNGLIQRERPAGRESPQQLHRDTTNGVPESSSQHPGPKVYGVVQRTGSDRQQEVMAREWTVNHLQDEMRYIREVRDSLEKVRERMYGQFGGMQQSMQRLSQELRTSTAHRRTLESEVRVRTAAMDSFDKMNSSLITANISLQKTLLEDCQNRVDKRGELKSLRGNHEKAQEELRNKEKELAAAQAENETLRLQVESSQEAGARALQDLSEKLKREYEEKLEEVHRKHREEIEQLQAQLDEYITRLEEAEWSIRTAEGKIIERDQRIVELERLLDCMGAEKSQFQKKLQECEQRLRLMELTDTTDSTVAKRTKQLQTEANDLRERIKHLNDMVFCQQRKVKGMIEEVESLRAQVAQKDMFISELLDRIAIVECENNELEDKLKYFMSSQNRPREVLETREMAVSCDMFSGYDVHDVESSHLHPMQLSQAPAQPPPSKKPSPLSPLVFQPLFPSQPPPSTARPSPITPAQLMSLTGHLSPIESLSPTESMSPTESLSPREPLSPTESLSPSGPFSPTEPLSPSGPLSPVGPPSLSGPFSPIEPLSPSGPFSPIEPPSSSGPFYPIGPLSPSGPLSPPGPLSPSGPFSPIEPPSSSGSFYPIGPLSPSGPLSPPGPLSLSGPFSSIEPPSSSGSFYPIGPLSLSGPFSPTGPLSPAGFLSPMGPLSLSGPLSPIGLPSPRGPLSPVGPMSPTQTLSPAGLLSPAQPLSPFQPLSFTQSLSSTQSLLTTQPPSYTQTLPYSSLIQSTSRYLTMPSQPRTFKPGNPPPSRLTSSLLRYTPVEYSRLLHSSASAHSGTFPYSHQGDPESSGSLHMSGTDEVDAGTTTPVRSNPVESTSSSLSFQARSRAPHVYSPFLKLMEMTANINIDDHIKD